jgi:hypothetical protein
LELLWNAYSYDPMWAQPCWDALRFAIHRQ